jgi:ATPase subunit of ABC transporter with duplicated ATPase domains
VALDGPGRELVAALLRDLPIGTTAVVASHDRRFLAAIGCDVRRLGPVGLECS